MTLNEIWNTWGKSGKYAVWGKLDGTWKHSTAVDGERATVDNWVLPSESGRASRIVNVSEFTEFDVSN